jgi:hypothetical protein
LDERNHDYPELGEGADIAECLHRLRSPDKVDILDGQEPELVG